MKNYNKKLAELLALSLFAISISNCASDETIEGAKTATKVAPTHEHPTLSINAMVVADPPPVAVAPVAVAPVPVAPIAPIAPPLPILPPPPPPLFIPGPEPFLNGTRDVPPEWANFVSGRGQLPSRHGNKTFLYSFERDIDDDHHRHDHRRD